MGKMYSTVEAGKLLGIKVRTMREWIRTGKIKAVKYDVSNRWFIPEEEVERIQSVEDKD